MKVKIPHKYFDNKVLTTLRIAAHLVKHRYALYIVSLAPEETKTIFHQFVTENIIIIDSQVKYNARDK